MAEGGGTLPEAINPNNFPAKLWRMVNSPTNSAICWDSRGEVIIIDQRLFEKLILTAGNHCVDSVDTFKTTHFSSFVRQLNLYGFKKAEPTVKTTHIKFDVYSSPKCSMLHHFSNPNFRRDSPQLLVNLKRLTVDNKAKLEAGLNVTSRLPSKYQRVSFAGADDLHNHLQKGNTSWLGSGRQASPHPYFTNRHMLVTPHNGTPVPPRYLQQGHGVPPFSSVFPPDKGVPFSLAHPYSPVISSPFQQGVRSSVNYGNPNFPGLHPQQEQCHPGYYSSACKCCRPLVPTGLQTRTFSTLGYYQAQYPVNDMGSPDLQNKNKHDINKSDINLDTVFQIADEVMQTPPNNNLTKIVTPEKQSFRGAPSYSTQGDIFRNTPQNITFCFEPITVTATGNDNAVTCLEPEVSVLSVPEQMPEDAISEVARDDLNNTEVILVEVSDTSGSDTSQV